MRRDLHLQMKVQIGFAKSEGSEIQIAVMARGGEPGQMVAE